MELRAFFKTTSLIFYANTQGVEGEGAAYPFLLAVGTIVQSTTAESGNATFTLALEALEFAKQMLGTRVEVSEGLKVLFEGIVTDIQISDSIEFQLEA